MSYKAITYDVKDEIAVVTMNRPEARNALDITMREEIADVTLRIRDDESLKAMVLTGAGGAFRGAAFHALRGLASLATFEQNSKALREARVVSPLWLGEASCN